MSLLYEDIPDQEPTLNRLYEELRVTLAEFSAALDASGYG
jgi:hypothetical protein